MMLQVHPYDLEFSYRPGTEIIVVDTLSRLDLPDINKKPHREIEVYVHQIACILPVSNARLKEIQLHTKEDEHLIHLKRSHTRQMAQHQKAMHHRSPYILEPSTQAVIHEWHHF
ncbi:hypothetical protein QYM36_004901 [Artemia franciscana]|uniref:Uncharacterized protein n=1 Tax=Artemia franciscana TaxID=6661 RepID=A0AA88HW77_ARTSF|nr:hypothetical protein QYM36_004901 [Artemia franciscana]